MPYKLSVDGVRHGIANILAEGVTTQGFDTGSSVPHPLDVKGTVTISCNSHKVAAEGIVACCDQLLARIESMQMLIPATSLVDAEHVTSVTIEKCG